MQWAMVGCSHRLAFLAAEGETVLSEGEEEAVGLESSSDIAVIWSWLRLDLVGSASEEDVAEDVEEGEGEGGVAVEVVQDAVDEEVDELLSAG